MIEAIIPILIVCIALVGINIRHDGEALSINQANSVKGIAALLLVVVYIREVLDIMPISYRILAGGGYLLVSVFFFYSGYGITKKGKTNARYVESSVPKRILYLIELIVVSEIIYYCVHITLFGRRVELLDLIKCITGLTMLNGALWTVTAMVIILVCIWGLIKLDFFVQSKNRYTIISAIGVIVYILITLLRGRRGAWEMQSCFAFSLGAFLAESEGQGKICAVVKRTRSAVMFTVIFCVAFIAPYIFEFLIKRDSMVIRITFGTIASLSFILLMIFILERVKIENRFTRYIGTLFTEIYVFHGLVLNLLKFYFPSLFCGENSLMVSIICIVTALIVAIGVKKIEKILKRED